MRKLRIRLGVPLHANRARGAGALLAAAGILALTPLQMVDAQSAPSKQSVLKVQSVGQSIIRGGAVSSGALSPKELQPGDDFTVGVKNETGGNFAPAALAASPTQRAFSNRQHGLRIPSKEAGRLAPLSGPAAAAAPAAASLLPPPTVIPNPAGSPLIDSARGVQGFNGLTHYDQRVAGTGIYTNTQFSLEPPDQGLCAGAGFVVEAINNAIAVYDTAGNLVAGPQALSQFWGLTPEIDRTTGITGQFISDPKCVYDGQTQRWFVTELMQDSGTVGSGRNFNLIAVSQTSDPRGAFTVIEYDVTDDGLNGTPSHAGCPCFGDQPLLGLDSYGIYQSTNEFGATVFNGSQIYAIPKQGLIDATHGDLSHLYVVQIDASQALVPYGGLSYSVQPAVGSGGEDAAESSGHGVEFFLSALQFGNPPYQLLDNRIAVWALANTRSLTTSSPALSLSFDVIASETYGQPNPARQKAGPTPLGTTGLPTLFGQPAETEEFLNTNDDRMNQVVYSGGVLYSAVNTIIGDGTRTGVAWFGVRPQFSKGSVSGRVVHQGYVAVNGESVFYPSLAVTGAGSGVMTFTLSGPDYFPSAAYVTVNGGGTSAVHIAADGTAPDDGFSGYAYFSGGNVGRWGDYSAAVSDGSNVWFATEYIPSLPRTVLANWGTFIGVLRGDN